MTGSGPLGRRLEFIVPPFERWDDRVGKKTSAELRRGTTPPDPSREDEEVFAVVLGILTANLPRRIPRAIGLQPKRVPFHGSSVGTTRPKTPNVQKPFEELHLLE